MLELMFSVTKFEFVSVWKIFYEFDKFEVFLIIFSNLVTSNFGTINKFENKVDLCNYNYLGKTLACLGYFQ